MTQGVTETVEFVFSVNPWGGTAAKSVTNSMPILQIRY
jgi:hypothetical protein